MKLHLLVVVVVAFALLSVSVSASGKEEEKKCVIPQGNPCHGADNYHSFEGTLECGDSDCEHIFCRCVE